MSRFQSYRLAAIPFITRSLRGGRFRRYGLLAGLLALLTVVLGTWVALGSGDFERELRVVMDLEDSRWERERDEFTLFARDAEEAHRLRYARDKILSAGTDIDGRYDLEYRYDDREWELIDVINDAASVLAAASQTPAPTKYLHLQQQARALQQNPRLGGLGHHDRRYFAWDSAENRAQLSLLVQRELAPVIQVYRSPLSTREAIRLIGAIAGCCLIALFLVFAPLVAGTQMAQETHENTLMPLTGTALRGRELVVGLLSGPLSVITLLAIPQAILFLLVAATTGSIVPAIGLLAVLAVGCLMLGMLTQLVGLAVGRARTPGIVGIGLIAALSMLAFIGAGIGLNMRPDFTGLLALLPEAASFHLLRSAVMPDTVWSIATAQAADQNLVIGTVGIGLLGLLGFRALERRLAGRSAIALTRGEAFLGALVSTVLVAVAVPTRGGPYYLATLALLSIPFAVLLMMRVPAGGTPPALRRTPVGKLLTEFIGYYGVHMVVAVSMLGRFGTSREASLGHPAALMHLGLFLVTAGLLSIRVVAQPLTTASRIWVGLTGMFLAFEFVHVLEWANRSHSLGTDELFVLNTVSPLLGFVQVVMTVLIPVVLFRGIRPRAPKA